MVEGLEGNGFLFRADRLVGPVRYRLRWSIDRDGRRRTEGELWLRAGARLQGDSGPYLLETGAGFTVPLEVADAAGEGWVAFRRAAPRAQGRRRALG